MTLGEILNMIAMKYPHSYTNAQIISIVNNVQQRFFRTIYKPETATTYDLLTDIAFYPIDFSPENIIDVVVNGREYPYQNIKYDPSSSHYYYITGDNTIGLYPTPTADVLGGLVVFHYKDPMTLSESDLSASPEFDSAFHMMLVLAVCIELAQIENNGSMLNILLAQYGEIERQYRQSRRARPHKIQDVYGVGRGAL